MLFYSCKFKQKQRLCTIGTKKTDTDALISALKDISLRFYKENVYYPDHHFTTEMPELVIRPRVAYHSTLKVMPLKEAENYVSKEMIMIYPPGIPLIIPGERFTKKIIEQILYYQSSGVSIISDYNDAMDVSVVNDEDNDENE